MIDLGDFFQATRKEIGVEEVASNVKNIVISCVIMIAGLANIEAERDSRNDAADSVAELHSSLARGRLSAGSLLVREN